MGKTALALVTSACYSANIVPPSALVGATDSSTLQLTELFYDCGRDLRLAANWPQLKRWHFVTLEPGRTQYPLPQDFNSPVPFTQFDQVNQWEMFGPLTDADWSWTTYGFSAGDSRRRFRIFGCDNNPADTRGQFYVGPTPQDADAGEFVCFEYYSRSWLTPPLWTASETVAQNIWRTSCGNNYKKTDASSEVGSTIAPNAANGVGQDGGVWWLAISASAWGATTAYQAGAYVTNGGNLYQAMDSGTSAGSGGPTGTDEDTEVTDSGVSWLYRASSTWAVYTTYAVGDHVVKGSNRYRCVQGPFATNSLKSGANGPDWTVSSGVTSVPDGSITWAYQPSAYEALVGDTDLCLFDDELMISGLKWRFMRARGMEYTALEAEYNKMKNRSASRWNPGRVLNLAGGRTRRAVNYAEGSW